MVEKQQSKADQLRAMREAKHAADSSRGGVEKSPRAILPVVAKAPAAKAVAGSTVRLSVSETRPTGVAPSPRETSLPPVPCASQNTAERSPSSDVGMAGGNPKRGRPRVEDTDKTLEATKPWLKMKPKMSRATWYARKAEGKL